jgi:hypothetical protein
MRKWGVVVLCAAAEPTLQKPQGSSFGIQIENSRHSCERGRGPSRRKRRVALDSSRFTAGQRNLRSLLFIVAHARVDEHPGTSVSNFLN